MIQGRAGAMLVVYHVRVGCEAESEAPRLPTGVGDAQRKRIETLSAEQNKLKVRIRKQALVRTWLSRAIIAGVIGTAQLAFWYHGNGYYGAAVALVILVVAWQVTRLRLRDLEASTRQLSYEAAVVESDDDHKAETLFLKNQFDLQRYYDQTLRHGDLIFYLGLVSLLASLGMVLIAFFLIREKSTETSVDIAIAGLAAVGSLFANTFVLLYRPMHRSAMNAIIDFHERLVFDHHLQFAHLLVSADPAHAAEARRRLAERIVELDPRWEPSTAEQNERN
jgi:hypothetical protein